MAFTFTIGGADFASYIAADGFKWERNDVDAPNSGRDMQGTMHRKVIARKYKLGITCRQLTAAEQTRLFSALAKNEVSVTFTAPDIGGTYAGTFYNSKRSGGIVQDIGNVMLYDGVSFNLTEV